MRIRGVYSLRHPPEDTSGDDERLGIVDTTYDAFPERGECPRMLWFPASMGTTPPVQIFNASKLKMLGVYPDENNAKVGSANRGPGPKRNQKLSPPRKKWKIPSKNASPPPLQAPSPRRTARQAKSSLVIDATVAATQKHEEPSNFNEEPQKREEKIASKVETSEEKISLEENIVSEEKVMSEDQERHEHHSNDKPAVANLLFQYERQTAPENEEDEEDEPNMATILKGWKKSENAASKNYRSNKADDALESSVDDMSLDVHGANMGWRG